MKINQILMKGKRIYWFELLTSVKQDGNWIIKCLNDVADELYNDAWLAVHALFVFLFVQKTSLNSDQSGRFVDFDYSLGKTNYYCSEKFRNTKCTRFPLLVKKIFYNLYSCMVNFFENTKNTWTEIRPQLCDDKTVCKSNTSTCSTYSLC